MTDELSLSEYTDAQLADEVSRLAAAERHATAALIAALAEFDGRRLYLALGYSSLFKYCVDGLKLTEDATFNRVEVARAVRKFPLVLQLLEAG